MAGEESGPARDDYWRALEEGRLTFQRCEACSEAWLPPRAECPHCWSPRWRREDASGRGTLLSWVVYHTAFQPEFKERLPYNVATVRLEEGPQLVTNIVDLPSDADVLDRPVSLVIERDHERALPRFRLA
jgi:uncharacterized protein